MSKIERNAIKKMRFLDETPLIVRLPRAEIRPDPDQPRKSRSREKLEGLAQTMLVKQLQPILVRQVDGEDGYMIVVGEGRWLGAGINEEKTGEEQYLDCILVDESNTGTIRSMQLIENLQREDMNELEVAKGFRELIQLGHCKNGKDVADHTGVSAATVSVFLKVLDGPEPVQQLVEKGIATMDTARTLLKLAEFNQSRADALVAAAIDSGILKRSSVRDAYAEEKARAENPAGAVEANQDATQEQSESSVDAAVQPQATAATLEPVAPQDASQGGSAALEQNRMEVSPHVVTDTAQKPQQNAVGAAQHASEGVGKPVVEKALESAPKTAPQPSVEAPKTAPAPAPTSTVNTAPTAETGTDVAPEAAADTALVVADKFDVLVSIRSGTPDEDRFITLEVEYGNARLASHIVHRESSRAWVQFGTGPGNEQLEAFQCGDLEIVKVVQRG